MAKDTRRLGVAIVTALLLTVTDGFAEEPIIVLEVDDSGCGVDPPLLDAAKQEVSTTYSGIGVSLIWSVRGRSGPPKGAFSVAVVLLSRVRTDTFLLRRRISSTVLGAAPHGTRRLYVFCGRITQRALRTGEKTERILGRVIAHELGHLLLPAGGHSPTGLMRPSLDYRSDEPLRFSDSEAASIRTLLTT
jgi:hypothetical protein